MAVAQRSTSVLEALPRAGAGVVRQARPITSRARRHVRVREPQLGIFLRRVLIAAIPAACILTAVYGRMQLLEATVQRSYLNSSVRQELNKQQVLHSELLSSTRPEQIDQFAKDQGLVMQVTPPIYVSAGGQRKGR